MKYIAITIFVVVLLGGLGYFLINRDKFGVDQSVRPMSEQTTDSQIVGGDEDEHGCKVSAGYSWCESKGGCLRTWEEPCGDNPGVEEAMQQAIANKYQKLLDTVIISTEKDTGDYAKGSVRFTDEMGGAIWFAAKVDDRWVLVADGQGPMACVVAEQYLMPNDFVPECITPNGELVVR